MNIKERDSTHTHLIATASLALCVGGRLAQYFLKDCFLINCHYMSIIYKRKKLKSWKKASRSFSKGKR